MLECVTQMLVLEICNQTLSFGYIKKSSFLLAVSERFHPVGQENFFVVEKLLPNVTKLMPKSPFSAPATARTSLFLNHVE